jgi:FkbM family methyltransferase
MQQTLKHMGLYERLRASTLYDVYWSFADRTLIADRRKELAFYHGLLAGFRPGDLIFDVGANHGSKTSTFLSLGARVIAVEPDKLNQDILKEMFLKYRFNPKPVTIVGKAVSDSAGAETMWIDEPGSAKNTFNKKWVEILRADEERFGEKLAFPRSTRIETTTLEELFTIYGVPFFVKIDVEGYELPVLMGLKRPVPFLSFEINLPEFREEGLRCVERLSRVADDGEFNFTRDCRFGLEHEKWLGAGEFSRVLEECSEPSIEVIWRTSANR